MSLRPVCKVSRYAQITSESKIGGSPGRSSTGTLPSGFSANTCSLRRVGLVS
jgi:hypothetical protein